MAKEICTIRLGDGWLDNDYTFFDDGTIKHCYDKHPTDPNKEEIITVDTLSKNLKKKLIIKCDKQHMDKVLDQILT